MNQNFAVIIPVFNHGPTLDAVVAKTMDLGFPVIVVDDGSTDGGLDPVLRKSAVLVLSHKTNQGKGAALLTGFRAAVSLGARWAVTLDADGQHHPEDARALIQAITPPARPIVIGCRQAMLDAGAPWTSRFGRHFSNFWIRASGGPAARDSQSGFRIYPLPEVLDLGVRSGRYQYELEVLVKAAWRGMAVVEAPIRVTYQRPEQRVSHFRPFVDFWRNSATFARLIFQRVTGRTSDFNSDATTRSK